LSIDKFARTLGYRRIAEDTWKTLTANEKKLFQAYADGVNDFVKGVKFSWISSAKLLPPEFYAFDLADKIEPWTPIDSLGILNLIKFSLTWDWPKDFMREILKSESPELAELADELVPYTAEYLHKLVTVLEEEDLRRMGKWSEETLSQKYKKNQDHLKAAEPKRKYGWRAEAEAAGAADA
jgi:acyl-homoserine lactone acylase PvdQ